MFKTKVPMKTIRLILILLSFSIWAYSQDVKVTVDAPKSVELGEQFQVGFTVQGNASNFNPPGFGDFEVLSGPNQSYNESSQLINNRLVETQEITLSYVLMAKKPGKFTISGAEFIVKGKKYPAEARTIEVVSAGTTQYEEKSDLFIKVFLDKSTAYQGEFVVATLKLFSRYRINQIAPNSSTNFEGFYKQDIETPPLRSLSTTTVNGKKYYTGTISRYLLIPQKTGNLTLPPLNLIVVVERSGFFDDPFFNQREQVELKSRPVSLNVKPLPSGKPTSFTGAVGKFNFSGSYDKDKVNANDPVILKLTVSGAGNLKLIDPPQLTFPNGIEFNDPSVTNKVNDKDGGISGTKTFEYLLIPRAPGKLELPPIEFSYFDPVAATYKTLTVPGKTLDVGAGAPSGTSRNLSVVSKEDLKFLGKDIQYIKTNPFSVTHRTGTFFGSLLFFAFYLVPFVLFIGILILRRNYIKQNANIVMVRNRKAEKFATKRLKLAKEYLSQNKKEAFYEEVVKALWGYLSDKLSIPVSDLSRENAKEQLIQRGMDEASLAKLIDIMDSCEYARYAPATKDHPMENDYQQAVYIITYMHQKVR